MRKLDMTTISLISQQVTMMTIVTKATADKKKLEGWTS
jgi:hypothetical protein